MPCSSSDKGQPGMVPSLPCSHCITLWKILGSCLEQQLGCVSHSQHVSPLSTHPVAYCFPRNISVLIMDGIALPSHTEEDLPSFSLAVHTLSLGELGGGGGRKETKTLLRKRKFSKPCLPHSCWTGY